MEQPQINTSPSSHNDTIVAVATPPGPGGIAVIRLSGPDAFPILEKVWKGAAIDCMKSHTAHLGRIVDGNGETVDRAVMTLFRAPNSFTGEDVAEISCHGSRWIQREIVKQLCLAGARGANPGEFTQRAFVNGRMDLAQAEGVADLIAASSRAAHRLAVQQTEGTFSKRLDSLRQKLIDLASLLELELDFSEEDVEFADRSQLSRLTDETISTVERLADSYAAGKAFKEGIPVVIAGQPNAGKSTLLNRLLDEEKAIVTDVPGTTRDIIDGTREIEGTLFRFIDTAGLRDTADTVERLGIERALDRLHRAAIVLWTIDSTSPLAPQLGLIARTINNDSLAGIRHLLLLNKTDLRDTTAAISGTESGKKTGQDMFAEPTEITMPNKSEEPEEVPVQTKSDEPEDAYGDGLLRQQIEITGLKDISGIIPISASTGNGLETLTAWLARYAKDLAGTENDILVTNARHYQALMSAADALRRARTAIADDIISADFIAQDIRQAATHLSEITGAIAAPDLLTTIFSRFCIGK